MRRIKFLGLAAVVLVAAFGVLAATAGAETTPKWFECAKLKKNAEKKYTGKYTDKVCTKTATPEEITAGSSNKYELQEGVGKAKVFKGKGKGTPKIEVETPYGNYPIHCKTNSTTGKPAVPNLETGVTFALSGCEFLTHSCKTPGGKKGEITGSGLVGELGFIKPEAGPGSEVGLRIENAGGEEKPLTVFECGEGETAGFVSPSNLDGALIGVQTGDVNVLTKEATLTYTVGKRYGKHVFAEKEYEPEVNILGWESELPEIEACSGQECATEHPAHVLKGIFCGSFVAGILPGNECTPPTYTGLAATDAGKGETLMVKT